MKRVGTSIFILCLFTILPVTLLAQILAPTSKPKEYSDTAAGLHDQFASIVDAGRSHDDIAFRGALDSLRIPREWLVANFDPHLLPQVSTEYDHALKRYQEHISWVTANFAKFDDFAVNVQGLESPAPVNAVGKFVAPVHAVKVEPFRLSSASSDPQHAPPSWVSSFVYIDGYFRYVGGTYTFWDEGLDGVRGPASLPMKTIHDRSVQGIVGRTDAIEMGPGIDGIVQFDVNRTGRGEVHTNVIEGEHPFIEDGEEYLKSENYGMPSGSDSPHNPYVGRTWKSGDSGITTRWSIEVVFWAPNK